MPEKRLQKTREANKELNCKHTFIYHYDSDIAPIIDRDGNRISYRECIECGRRENYKRSQKKFLQEINAEQV